jgi:serine/threonine protein kinase
MTEDRFLIARVVKRRHGRLAIGNLKLLDHNSGRTEPGCSFVLVPFRTSPPAMPFSDSTSLASLLARLQLVDPETLEACQRELRGKRSADELMSALARRNALTAYQMGRIKKGETDGLRLGPYKLLYRNASGSFARVYRAASVEDGQIVGIKLLRQRWASDPRIVSLFRREGELGKRLKHRNIVPIYDVISESGKHYLTMEFVEGGNLRDFLKIRKKFSPAEATKYVIDMAEGLQYALNQGFTHRDLKLTNVLLSSQGVAKLVDFGLAGNDNALTPFEEEVDRAVEYAALERGTHAPDNDPRTDLYFLGAIYYELLTGHPPYPPTRDRQERKRFSRYRNVRPPKSVDPNVPTAIEAIVMRLMHIDPDHRYQRPAEALGDLRGALAALRPSESSSSQPDAGAPYADEESLLADDTATSLTGSDTTGEDSGSFGSVQMQPPTPTILCVEHRGKHQDSLRNYFSKHGYRVLILADPQRALLRLKSSPPDALVLIGDAIGAELPKIYESALAEARRRGTAVVVVLGKKKISGIDRLADGPWGKILPQPVTLRDIRHAVRELRHRNASTG